MGIAFDSFQYTVKAFFCVSLYTVLSVRCPLSAVRCSLLVTLFLKVK